MYQAVPVQSAALSQADEANINHTMLFVFLAGELKCHYYFRIMSEDGERFLRAASALLWAGDLPMAHSAGVI